MTFAGTEGAIFNQYFDIESRRMKNNNGNDPLGTRYDMVKNKACTSEYSFVTDLDLNNVTFTRMDFRGANGRIYMMIHNPNTTIKDLTISHCIFITATPDDMIGPSTPNAATFIYIQDKNYGTETETDYDTPLTNTIENFTYKNNKVDGHYQGVQVNHFNNATITNNTIKNTIHNAIAVQSRPGYTNTGNLTITNNYIENVIGSNTATRDRAIRLGYYSNATIIISNNTFKNASEDRTADNEGVQLLASNTLTNCTYEFSNNTYDGEALQDISDNQAKLIVYIVEPIIEE